MGRRPALASRKQAFKAPSSPLDRLSQCQHILPGRPAGFYPKGCLTGALFIAKHPNLDAVHQVACLVVCAALLTLPLMSREAVLPDQTTSAQNRASGETLSFAIPRQPLAGALRVYSEFTGQAVLFDDTLTVGRESPGIYGSFVTEEALRRLLAGTGLSAKYSSNRAFTLHLLGPDEKSDQREGRRSDETIADGQIEAMTAAYAGKIQRPIQAALCRSAATRPGTYRLALQIWVAPTGAVEIARVLSAPNAKGQHLTEVRQALEHLTLEPPPPLMPQPVTLLLLQGDAAFSSACAAPLRSAH